MNNSSFLALIVLASTLAAQADSQSSAPQASPATPASGSKTVKLCDNKTTVQVPNEAPKTRAEAQKISAALMAQWKATNPDTKWVQEEVEAHQVETPTDKSKLAAPAQSSTYGTVTQQHVHVWKNETSQTTFTAAKVFHTS